MNNEINRRDFMKLSVASIMTASVTLNLGNTAFATTASENPKDVLKNFFESFSPTDHESWVNYFASSVDEKGAVKNVAFSTYLKNVTYNEIGNMGYYDEAIKANVMAIKMCGWWAHAAGYRSAEGCDIKYGDVAYKSSYQTKPAITNAINAVDGKKLVSSGGQLFFTSYFAGSSNTDGKNSGRLRQNGSNYLASTKSYTYTEILHYYYDNSSYNNPSVGIVKIN